LNLRAQVRLGGLAPWGALQTATKLPAAAFGVADDLGTIEPGKLADLAFIDGNPLDRIEDLANGAPVMKNGEGFTVSDLMAPFQTPASGQGHRMLAPAPETEISAQRYWWHDLSLMGEDD